MSKRMDHEARNRHDKAKKGGGPPLPRAPTDAFSRAYADYANVERGQGRKPLSRQQWRDKLFGVLTEGKF